MKDEDCGDDTDFDPYECDHECCPCVPNKLPMAAFVEGGDEPVPLAQRTASINLWLSADTLSNTSDLNAMRPTQAGNRLCIVFDLVEIDRQVGRGQCVSIGPP